MKTIHSYLTFNGNCREALTFYQKCLGGELSFQTIGESALSGKMPAKMKKCILHSELRNGKIVLFGSDIVSGKKLLKGNAVSLALICKSEKDIRRYYTNLSRDGEETFSLQENFLSTICGELTDKFGNNWILYLQHK